MLGSCSGLANSEPFPQWTRSIPQGSGWRKEDPNPSKAQQCKGSLSSADQRLPKAVECTSRARLQVGLDPQPRSSVAHSQIKVWRFCRREVQRGVQERSTCGKATVQETAARDSFSEQSQQTLRTGGWHTGKPGRGPVSEPHGCWQQRSQGDPSSSSRLAPQGCPGRSVCHHVGRPRQDAGTVMGTAAARVGRSTAYSSLLQSTHGPFLGGGLCRAAVDLGPRVPGLHREAGGVRSGLPSSRCTFCWKRDTVRPGACSGTRNAALRHPCPKGRSQGPRGAACRSSISTSQHKPHHFGAQG